MTCIEQSIGTASARRESHVFVGRALFCGHMCRIIVITFVFTFAYQNLLTSTKSSWGPALPSSTCCEGVTIP